MNTVPGKILCTSLQNQTAQERRSSKKVEEEDQERKKKGLG